MAASDTAPGQMRRRVAFDKRTLTDDGAGNREGDFEEQFECWARIVPRLGGDEVMAARLQGVQPATITVRSTTQTRAVGLGWRIRHLATGIAYTVRAISNVDEKDRTLDILCESGRPV